MAIKPTITQAGLIGRVRVAAANTASDGSGTINKFLTEDNVTVFSGGASGSRLEKIVLSNSQAAAAASSAMVIRIFISDSSGANWRLWKEVSLLTVTRSTTVVGAQGEIPLNGADLGTGVQVGVGQSVYAGAQDQMDYILEYANY